MRANLATLVDTWRANGSQTAIVTYTGNRSTRKSYADLVGLTQRVAAELARRGIAPEERVVLWGKNGAEWVAAFFACVVRGVLVVPLDAAGSLDFACRVLKDTAPRLVIGDADLIAGLGREVPALRLDELAALPDAKVDSVPLTRESPLQILFTSGTTSEPKGIVHTHGNVLASVEPIEREMAKYGRYERWFHPLRFLHTLPLSHVFGQFMGLWLPPLLAAEVHFESRLEAERVIRTIRRERITVLAAVPRMLDLVRSYLLAGGHISQAELDAARTLPVKTRIWRFRRIHTLLGWKFWAFVCGGASLPGDLEQFWNTLGFAVVQGYGMTETAALITLNHPFKVSRGSIGKALPGREVRIGPEGEVSVRGEMVSTATWIDGGILQRTDPWLSTGDLAAADAEGNLRFVGRKSETIVNASGLNIHPEDVEAALLRRPEISACAVVPIALPGGANDAAAVLVAPAGRSAAEQAVLAANKDLAEFQRVRRWLLWPEADLPRTSTGKVQRRKVAEWVARQGTGPAPDRDSLTALIASVTGTPASRSDDAARLSEDLGLDSLGLVQLQTAIERRFGIALDDETFLAIVTLGQLRAAIGAPTGDAPMQFVDAPPPTPRGFIYPKWPWWSIVTAIRIAFLEAIARPIVWFLLNPKVPEPLPPLPGRPMLLIANHATLFDVPLLLYGLPRKLRGKIAVAAGGEMVDDWRQGRNQGSWWQNLLARPEYWLLTALFNIFPLPKNVGFRRSFAHIGEALDRGYSVLVFPEGHRSEDGTLRPFRPGIGILAQESNVPVLPVALKGMDVLVARKSAWFHAGLVEVRIGEPIQIENGKPSEDSARTLHAELARVLQK